MKTAILIALSSVGAYGQWITGFYAPGGGRAAEPVSAIPWQLYTHIVHQGAWPNRDGTIGDWGITSETRAMVAAKPPGRELLIQFGDNPKDPQAFSIATTSGSISRLVSNFVSYVNNNSYDGVELDWEMSINVTQYINLITRLRAAMPNKIIAMDGWGVDAATPAVAASTQAQLDHINLMCYDLDNNPWNTSWYNAALVSAVHFNGCDVYAAGMKKAGVAAGKIGIGIPFYGRRWVGCTQALVSGCQNRGYFLYRDLVTDPTRWQSQYQRYDTQYKSNYLSIPGLNEFDSYNGPQFMTDLVAWAKANGFGGYMTFGQTDEYIATQTADAQYPLSNALYIAVFNDATDLRTQLINRVLAETAAGIQVNGYATLMNADQWAYYYSEIRPPINTDGSEINLLLNALEIPSTEPQRSAMLITVDQFIEGLRKIGLVAVGARRVNPSPYVWLPVLLGAALLAAGTARLRWHGEPESRRTEARPGE